MAMLRSKVMALMMMIVISSFFSSSANAKSSVIFECTTRQEAEDLEAIRTESYRYHQSMVRLGLCALRNDEIEKGREWLEKAAYEHNDPEAKNNLGVMHATGHGVEMDPKKSYQLYLEAAEGGCSDAMHNLGVMYDTGKDEVLAIDHEEAAKWFRQAADKNNLESIHALALMESSGRGVEMNLKSAIKKFIKLASLDNDPPYPNAHYMLGLLCLKGQIVNKLPLQKILPEEYTKSYRDILSSGGGSDSDMAAAKRMQDLVLGVKLIRYASEMGHPQATDQLEQLLQSLDEVDDDLEKALGEEL